MARILYIGNKNVSSWSMRAWLALKEKGVTFEERVIDLASPERTPLLASLSYGRRVPVLHDEDVVIFDSLAIGEYANEAFPGPPLLPSDPKARARARSLVAWMHSGFGQLRAGMPFEATFHPRRLDPPSGAIEEAGTAAAAWEAELTRSGGPYLVGPLSLADLTFVPVIHRLSAYGFSLQRFPRAQRWADTMMARGSVREWMDDAEKLPPYPLG